MFLRSNFSYFTTPFYRSKKIQISAEWVLSKGSSRTLGIAACPLNRLRTRLSIPLGFLHDGSTPVQCQSQSPFPLSCGAILTFEAVALVPVEALRVCDRSQNCRFQAGGSAGGAYASSRSGRASWRQPSGNSCVSTLLNSYSARVYALCRCDVVVRVGVSFAVRGSFAVHLQKANSGQTRAS